MSTVMYGRREGQSKRTINLATELPKVGLLAQGIDPRDVAVFQPKDWERIQNSLSRYNREVEKQEAKKKERNALHDKSKDLVKHWENTIEGQRLKKLQARKIREEQEEIERQKIDIEEAKLQAEKRKEAIQRAKKLQYYETDRVKGFHGALLLTEVLKERDAQIAMKNAKRDWQKDREAYNLAVSMKNQEEDMKADFEKQKEKYDHACAVRNFQKLQIRDREDLAKQEKEDDIIEGKNIKKQVETFQAAKQAIDSHNRHTKEILRDTYLKEIDLKEVRAERERAKDEEQNVKLRKFVNAKRKMTTMRKQKELELFNEFNIRTGKMRDKLAKEMQQKVDDEDVRIERAQAEREKKRLEVEQQKKEATKEALDQIKEHRLQMITNAVKHQEESLKKDKLALEKRIKEDHVFQQKNNEDKVKSRQKLAELQSIHKTQMVERKKAEEKKRDDDLDFDKKDNKLLLEEEQVFQRYACNVIDDAKKGGRNPFPLIKAKNEGPGGGRGPKFEGKSGLRPSYIVSDATGVQLPHYVKDENVYSRCYGHVGKSGKRIGFTW